MWHFPNWLHVYSFVFTNLRHNCKEQICVNPFFSSSKLLATYPKKLQFTNKIATHYTCKLVKKKLVTALLWNHSQVQILRIWSIISNQLWTDKDPARIILQIGTNDLKSQHLNAVADHIIDLARKIEKESNAQVILSEVVISSDDVSNYSL